MSKQSKRSKLNFRASVNVIFSGRSNIFLVTPSLSLSNRKQNLQQHVLNFLGH